MNLEGKIINFLGDSITEGRGVTDVENCRYDNIVKKRCRLSKACNYGIGGTRSAHQRTASPYPRHDLYFCGRCFDLNRDADITVVFGGTNDYGRGDVLVGEMTDQTPNTFCGAVDFLINALMDNYPKTRLVFMTPAHWQGDRAPSTNPGKLPDALPLFEYVRIIKEKCKEYSVPVLDLYETLGIDPNDDKIREAYTTDGLHFNDEGHKQIAERLIDFLQKL